MTILDCRENLVYLEKTQTEKPRALAELLGE